MNIQQRVTRLETLIAPNACPRCLGRPHRVVTIDADSSVELCATMPADGCPECGRPVFREYLLEGMD